MMHKSWVSKIFGLVTPWATLLEGDLRKVFDNVPKPLAYQNYVRQALAILAIAMVL